MKTVFTHYRI